MDERPMEVMQKTLKVIRKADPDFKVSLAGNYHEEKMCIRDRIADGLSCAPNSVFHLHQ